MKQLLLLPLALVILLNGCVITSPERQALSFVETTAVTVNTLRLAYEDMVDDGAFTLSEQAKVHNTYREYQRAMRSLKEVVITCRTAKEIGTDTGEAAELDTAITLAEKTAVQVISLLRILTDKTL